MHLDAEVIRDSTADDLPPDEAFASWGRATLAGLEEPEGRYGLAIRIVDEPESRALNRRYRDRDRPTNVLSFSAGVPESLHGSLGFRPLGDLVMCATLVAREAAEQGKDPAHHWAHLTVHGVMHLLGWNHEEAGEAARMEERERLVLAALGVPDPYAEY